MNIDYAILTVVSSIFFYLLGFGSGWLVRTKVLHKEFSFNEGSLVLLVVTLIWAISVVFDIANPEYETPVVIHGLMGAIVGFFYKPALGRGGNGKD